MTWLKRKHLKELENTGENLGSLKSHISFFLTFLSACLYKLTHCAHLSCLLLFRGIITKDKMLQKARLQKKNGGGIN